MQNVQANDNEDYESYPLEWEASEEKCSTKDCTGYMMKAAVQDGADDFTFIWHCPVCGTTESE